MTLFWIIILVGAASIGFCAGLGIAFAYIRPQDIGAAKGSPVLTEVVKARTEVVKAFINYAGLLAIICAAFGLWMDVQETKRQVDFAERRLVSEKFSTALEYLDSTTSGAKMGAIYTLRSIADDEQYQHDYYYPVMSILAGYVRDYESRYIKPGTPLGSLAEIQPLPADLQAAISGICYRDIGFESSLPEREQFDIFLAGADLRGAAMEGANLSKVIMKSARLDGAALHNSTLGSVDLTKASLVGTHFAFAHLEGADFSGVKAGMILEQFKCAYIDDLTAPPDYCSAEFCTWKAELKRSGLWPYDPDKYCTEHYPE